MDVESNRSNDPAKVLAAHESEKKKKYLEGILLLFVTLMQECLQMSHHGWFLNIMKRHTVRCTTVLSIEKTPFFIVVGIPFSFSFPRRLQS